MDKALIQQIDDFTDRLIKEWSIPGAAMGIVSQGDIVHLKGYGQKGIDDKTPINQDTLFPIASISKGMSAAAMALLVEEGCFHWQHKVIELLPDFKLHDPWITNELRVVDLFCHRTGFAFEPLQQIPLWGYTAGDLKRLLPQIELPKSFRNSYQYTNILYLFVQEIIEKFSRLSFSQFMVERLFKPLGMNARVGLHPEFKDQLIHGHVLDELTFSEMRKISFSCYPHIHMAAGGVVASPSDVCKWIQAQLGHTPFLTKSRIKYMWKPQTVISENEFYGLGWRILTHKPKRIISHGGLIKGIRHLLYMVPDSDFGIFILTNFTHQEAPLKICEFATDLAMGITPAQDHLNAKTIYLDSLKINCPEAVADINFEPSDYTGTYSNSILDKAEIIYQNNQLQLLLGNKPAIALLEPVALGKFRIFFTGDSGHDIAEGHWGTATFSGTNMVMKASMRFDHEEFHFTKIRI